MQRIARPIDSSIPPALGVVPINDGVEVAVFSRHADKIWFCTFDDGGREVDRWLLAGQTKDLYHGFVPGVGVGRRYGLRADGPFDIEHGHRFDPAKLLVDPYATRLDRPFHWTPELAAPRSAAIDTSAWVPRAIVEARDTTPPTPRPPRPPTFIYEIEVKAYTARNLDAPEQLRGSINGLASPRVVDYLARLGVSHVELMPVTAWLDERHLAPLGLSNAWGYNPIAFMALDPRLAAGGIADLKHAVDALRAANISVLLDVVFNHSGESDLGGATISLRGLDNAVYYRHTNDNPPQLVNDTGCGNTLACDREPVSRLIIDTLRYFVVNAGVDGFRFDLATTLARLPDGFSSTAPFLTAISRDPVLSDRILIAEPWDVGPGGYRLGAFPSPWREWNDRFRDGVRRFWRGDGDATGDFATRLAGSADIFTAAGAGPFASVNFVAAHDGFTLRDLVSFEHKHNEANGEGNRDGANENYSWNCGVEGETADPDIRARRLADARALLASLFLARGLPMLTAGDEFGRTQDGNNNAYARPNGGDGLDWAGADHALSTFVAGLARLRQGLACFSENRFLTGQPAGTGTWPDVVWTKVDGKPFASQDWAHADFLSATFASPAREGGDVERVHVIFNRAQASARHRLPEPRAGYAWAMALNSASQSFENTIQKESDLEIAARCVMAFVERRP